ncbi:hypothetical protein STEG23_019917, partial [Scotinomys teguina]
MNHDTKGDPTGMTLFSDQATVSREYFLPILSAWQPALQPLPGYRPFSSLLDHQDSLGSGQEKAFSTCASHLTVVVVSLEQANFNYDRPREGYSLDMDILVSVLFCVVTSISNPIIYSLRNKVKGNLRKFTKQHGFS